MNRKVFLIGALILMFVAFGVRGDDAGAIYKSKCAACHGPDGSGSTAMGKKLNVKSLQSPDVQKQNDDELTQKIAKGKDKMPAFEKKLTADQLKALVTFIRSLAKK